MLYLVKVNLSMEWSDLPAQTVLRAVAEHGAPLDGVEWEPVERIASDTTVALALRYGVACLRGIAVDGIYPVLQSRPGELEELRHPSPETRAAVSDAHGIVETMFPGSAEHRRHLEAGADRSMQDAVAEAHEDVAEALAAPVRPELVEHWRSLGGHVPRGADEQRLRRRSSGTE